MDDYTRYGCDIIMEAVNTRLVTLEAWEEIHTIYMKIRTPTLY